MTDISNLVPGRMIMPWTQIGTWKVRADIWDKWDQFAYFTCEIPMRHPRNIIKDTPKTRMRT